MFNEWKTKKLTFDTFNYEQAETPLFKDKKLDNIR
jgi:hypothetical protein